MSVGGSDAGRDRGSVAGRIGSYGVLEIGEAVRTYLRDLRCYGAGVAGIVGSVSTSHLGSSSTFEAIAARLDPDR